MDKIQNLLEELTGTKASEELHSNDTKPKAFAWARVSTDMQEKRGLSMPQQLKEIREYADRQGIEIIEQFQEATSAFSRNGKRPEFDRMIEQAKSTPDINAIIVHDYSRFSRDSVEGPVLMRNLHESGIRVLSVSEPEFDPGTVAGVFGNAFTFANNQAYSLQIAFHTRKGCKANIRMRDPKSGWCFKNGGKPIWGYKLEHVEFGVGKGNKPILKSIWVLDDTVVAGRPVHEWAHHCLVELAMKGASYVELRDFCNETGIPGREDKYWGIGGWKDLLLPWNLLKYAGYAVWNVRGKRVRVRPANEWEVAEKAHPAIVTPDEAIAIAKVRQQAKADHCPYEVGNGRARKSEFLLSGGVSVCNRCKKNLVGHRNASGTYYVCGSEPYRKGRGCGPGVYVPQLILEDQVIAGIQGIIAKLADPERFTRKVNAELKRIWRQETGVDPDAEKRIREIDMKIAHIRKLLEEGLDDVKWANERLRELRQEHDHLSKALAKPGQPVQVDSKKAMEYRADLARVFRDAKPEERKQYVRAWVEKITLFPDRRELEIRYRVPEPVLNNHSAGPRACPRQ